MSGASGHDSCQRKWRESGMSAMNTKMSVSQASVWHECNEH